MNVDDFVDGALPITFGVLIVVAVVLAIVAGVKASNDQERRYAAFMAECQADGRKGYECDALWGQASGSGSTVVPVPIVIPIR